MPSAAPPADAELAAACAFAALPGVGPSTLSRIAKAFGSFDEALRAGNPALRSRALELRLGAATLRYLEDDPDLERLGQWALDAAGKASAHALLLGRDGYPPLLARSAKAPVVLYVRGTLAAERQRIAVVGARDCDEAGLAKARTLGEDLARAGIEVVSGGARGVDAAAHAGALWGSGTTVAVLGCGIDQVYPAENGELFERIATGRGALVSELVPGSQPLPRNFPLRNRIIAGLSQATVVVRAAARSGALVTARDAAREGRPVFVLRGLPGGALSEGPALLVRNGLAREVDDAAGVCAEMGWLASEQGATERPVREPRSEVPVDETAKRLLALLDAHTGMHVDELAARAHVSPQEALRKLTELEVMGLCRQRPGKYFIRC